MSDSNKLFFWFVVHSLAFTVTTAIILGLTQLIPVKFTQFFERDNALSYYNIGSDQVPVREMYIINFVILAGITLFASMFDGYGVINTSKPDSLNYMPKFNLKLFYALGIFAVNCPIITNIITEILKRTASEARPSAFYLCNYAGYADAANSGNYTQYYDNTVQGGLGNISKCLNRVDKNNAFMSWPSRHASTSFTCMLACTLILNYIVFQQFNKLFSLLNFLPYCTLIIAAWISVTRVQDYKHHQSDIFCGATIGLSVTILLWSLFQDVLKMFANSTNRSTTSTNVKNDLEVLQKQTNREDFNV
jgi:membrane-associated phospholipid phosphatase